MRLGKMQWALGATLVAVAASSAGVASASPASPVKGDTIDYVACSNTNGIGGLAFVNGYGNLVNYRRITLWRDSDTWYCGKVSVTVGKPMTPYLEVTGEGKSVACGIWVNDVKLTESSSGGKAICGHR